MTREVNQETEKGCLRPTITDYRLVLKNDIEVYLVYTTFSLKVNNLIYVRISSKI